MFLNMCQKNMNKFIRYLEQRFCEHIFKTTKTEILSKERYKYKCYHGADGLMSVDCINRVHTKECVKCGKIIYKTDSIDEITNIPFELIV